MDEQLAQLVSLSLLYFQYQTLSLLLFLVLNSMDYNYN